MADPKARKKQETVLIRIKRMGKQWATCGIGLRPPEHLIGRPQMKRLCPKLVPGQVVELPVTHPLVKKRSPLVEIVPKPERDEHIRPWVFKSAEQAALSNPSKSRLGADQIAAGLAMSQGAIENAPEHRKKRQEAQAESDPALEDYFNEDYDEPDGTPEPEFETDEQLAQRSQNRMTRAEKEDARPVEDDEPVQEKPRARRSRTRRG